MTYEIEVYASDINEALEKAEKIFIEKGLHKKIKIETIEIEEVLE